jgi:hypothetical protein
VEVVDRDVAEETVIVEDVVPCRSMLCQKQKPSNRNKLKANVFIPRPSTYPGMTSVQPKVSRKNWWNWKM